MIHVVEPGPLCTVQDRGRPRLAHFGVGRSGAVDRPAAALGNRLVGNHGHEALLEMTLGGLVVRFERACLVAVTGARSATTGHDLGDQQPVAVPAGTTVRFAPPSGGVRTYLAVRGGIDVAPVLGSRSCDVLGRLGPRPVRAGDRLPIGPDPGTAFPTGPAPRARVPEARIGVWPGPRTDWFEASALDVFSTSTYSVLPTSNRIGVRLDGLALARRIPGELPSEGIVEGAVQVPPDGQPLVFLADHPATGGYPVIAVVDPAELPLLAQRRPGDQVNFRWLAAPPR